MDLHSGESAYFSGHPSWRGSFAFHAGGVAASILVGALIFVIGSPLIGIAVAVVGTVITILFSMVQRMATTFTITDERLIIERGLLSKRMQQTRIERVQNVNTSQSVLERMLNVGVVDFDTAGSGDSDFSFTGVAHPAEIVAVVDRAQRAAHDRDTASGAAGDGL